MANQPEALSVTQTLGLRISNLTDIARARFELSFPPRPEGRTLVNQP
jgi:hypothetical protein